MAEMKYFTGHNDSSVRKFMIQRKDLIKQNFSHAIIESLDSTNILQCINTIKLLETANLLVSMIDDQAIVRVPFPDSITDASFFGFDEIWFFASMPLMSKPTNLYITGPTNIRESPSTHFSQWMQSSNCILGVGDGCGLNYITTESDIADSLAALSATPERRD